MKTVFVNSILPFDQSAGIIPRLDACYTNTGNLVWHEKCKKEIDYDYEVELCNFSKGLEDCVLVVPVANIINPYESVFSKRLRCLLDVKAQIVLIGVGVQADRYLNTPKKILEAIPKSKIRLLRQIADKSISIGVRGGIAADCLEKMGIHNYKIIGCPSFYSSMLQSKKIVMPSAKLQKVCINVTGGGKNDHRILELVLKSGLNSRLIMQGVRDMPEVRYENRNMTKGKLEKSLPNIAADVKSVEKYWKKNGKIFFGLSEWEKYISEEEFTFSFGTRLHGNMLQFLMGVPSLWIIHDSRTKEIVDLLKLPYITEKKLEKIRYVEEIMEKCLYEKEFYENFYRLRHEYIRFLDENRVKHNFIS